MRRVQLDEKPSWRILLDVTKLDRLDPWKIDLLSLLREFKQVIESRSINLVYAGVAIHSASTIHRLKSERLLSFDKPREPKERPELLVPPPLDVPIKSNVVVTTILDVVQALRSVLMSMEQRGNDSKFEQINVDIKIDDYLLKIEEELEYFIEFLESILADKGYISFMELIENVDRLEAARRFILVLFAASRGRVELVQEEGTLDIIIRLVVGGEETG